MLRVPKSGQCAEPGDGADLSGSIKRESLLLRIGFIGAQLFSMESPLSHASPLDPDPVGQTLTCRQCGPTWRHSRPGRIGQTPGRRAGDLASSLGTTPAPYYST